MMKLALTLGGALAAMTVAAAAQTGHRVFVGHGPAANIDANEDGWITRAEASAAADRMFADMDSNGDGRLDSEDRSNHRVFEFRMGGHGAHEMEGDEVEVIEGNDGTRRVIRRRGGAGDERRVERHVERVDGDTTRDVVILHGGGEWVEAPEAPHPPAPPHPPHAPMFMMLIANSEEADTNGDGALSREEFRAQQLRFFDASDANGDGRVRFERPPAPPEPPAPPSPPSRR